MANQPLFSGLIVDEFDNPVSTAFVGSEGMYVVDDAGFHRHIPAREVDLAVLAKMRESIEGHEDILSEQAAKMMGQDDPFSIAMLQNQFKNMEQHFDELLKAGIPEESRTYLGMAGFRVRINYHGEVIEVVQPGAIDPESE